MPGVSRSISQPRGWVRGATKLRANVRPYTVQAGVQGLGISGPGACDHLVQCGLSLAALDEAAERPQRIPPRPLDATRRFLAAGARGAVPAA